MKPPLKVASTIGAVVALTALWAGPASAAPTYVSSEPADGERVHKAPEEVSVTFSEPLDPSSTLEVRDDCGRRADDEDVRVENNTMTVGMAVAYSGTYTVLYEAVGLAGLTGTTEDDFNFTVHMGPGCDGSAGGHGGHGDEGGGTEHGDGHQGGGQHEGGRGEHAGGEHVTHEAAPGHGGGHGDHHGEHDTQKATQGTDQSDDSAPGPSVAAAGEQPTTAADRAAPPSASVAIVALALAAVVGVVGGWVLRVSAPS